jgi:hypothetical protein
MFAGVQLGSAADWVSVLVNAVIAGTAVFGIRLAMADARTARSERDEAREQLRDERRRQAAVRQAQQEFELVRQLAEIHGALADPYVSLTPIHRGTLTSCLAALPSDRLPFFRAWWNDDVAQLEERLGPRPHPHAEVHAAVAAELAAEMSRLNGDIAAPA